MEKLLQRKQFALLRLGNFSRYPHTIPQYWKCILWTIPKPYWKQSIKIRIFLKRWQGIWTESGERVSKLFYRFASKKNHLT